MARRNFYKVLCICGHGLGSSMMLRMTVESVFADLGVDANVETACVAEAGGCLAGIDLVIISPELRKLVDIPDSIEAVEVINFLDKAEVKAKLENFFSSKE